MTPTATLRTVTLQTVANYTQAAECAVRAYRVGGHRLIAAAQRTLDRATAQGPDRMGDVLRRASGNVGDLASKGVDALSNGSQRVIGFSSRGLTTRFDRVVDRVVDLMDGVDNRVVVNGLRAVSRASLPGAQAALALSQRVAAVALKLPGTPLHPVAVKVNAKVKPKPKPSLAQAAKPGAAARRRAPAKADASVQAVVAQAAASVKKIKKIKKTVAPVVAKPQVAAVKASAAKSRIRVRRAASASPVVRAAAALDSAVASA